MAVDVAIRSSGYAELFCLSNYSFLAAASHPHELVEQAAALGYRALAITDECSLAGVVKAHAAAMALAESRRPLQLVIGAYFQLDGQRLVALCPTLSSYQQLCELISRARRRSAKGSYSVDWGLAAELLADNLLVWLPSGVGSDDQPRAHWLAERFAGRCWIGVSQLLDGADRSRLEHAQQLASTAGLALTACGEVRMHSAERQPLLDCLNAIRNHCSVMELGARRHSNAERRLRSLDELATAYPPALLAESVEIARRCRFSLAELRYRYPDELVPAGFSANGYLRQLVASGAAKRWPKGIDPRWQTMIDRELALIAELDYACYFLTVYDLVAFAQQRGILYQGRGSAANSISCYCLFITEVSPEQIGMLFERFISKERREPPDIDVDFEHQRREEVIQYIYQKYGRRRAALAAAVVTYRPRSALRDIGRALAIDPLLIEQLSHSMGWWQRPSELHAALAGDRRGGPIAALLYQLVEQVQGFPRHLSQHVGGFIISDGPLSELVPIENASMAERTIIQWDKNDIELLGLMKVDVLALGMLTTLRHCFELINRHRSAAAPLSLAALPKEDSATYQMLSRGDSVGVFQVESRAQMAMLPRLAPKTFYDLVIQVAIVRPGPIQGEMVHPYLRRRAGREAVSYPSAEIEAVLQRTLGVPIFQEQVIRLAMVAAGFSGGAADQLRRAMADWGKNSRLDNFEEQLVSGMLARGYSEPFARQLFQQIRGFGGYGFPESHSASFALLSYFSAYLKCHHPAAFCCALLNSQPMGFYPPAQLIQDAQRHAVSFYPADANHSEWLSTLVEGSSAGQPAVRLGLHQIKGLSAASGERLVAARAERPFASLADLASRAQLNQRDCGLLAGAGALHSINSHRRQSQWQALAINEPRPLLGYQRTDDGVAMAPDSELETLYSDYQRLGYSLHSHPLAHLRDHPELRGCKRAAELDALGHRRFVRIAGLVTCRQRPSSASGVLFLTLEDESGSSNVVVWVAVQQRCQQALLRSQLLRVKGVVEKAADSDGRVVHVIAQELTDLTTLLGSGLPRSRDFR